jgi:hypothetical protein
MSNIARRRATLRAGLTASAFLSATVLGFPAHADPAAQTLDIAAFEQLKSLAGRWEGRIDDAEHRLAAVEYEVTSNGRTVIERQFPGTGHEMVTVYYLAYDRLQATHYCAMGNQPAYKLASASTPANIVMEAAGGTGFDPERDTRANGERIEIVSPGEIRVEFQFRKGNEPPTSARLLLSRVPARAPEPVPPPAGS